MKGLGAQLTVALIGHDMKRNATLAPSAAPGISHLLATRPILDDDARPGDLRLG